MTIEQAKEYIRTHATDYLKQDGTKKGFICPVCNSGAGSHGTGIKTADNIHFTCFANNCFSNADIIDIIAIEHGIQNTDFITKLKESCRAFNISLEDTTKSQQNHHKNTEVQAMQNDSKARTKQEQKTDFTEYYKQCNSDLPLTDYWAKRGISSATCKKFMLGYDKQHNAIVIPISKYAYKTRRTDIKQFYNSKGGAMELFNSAAINNDIVYICESETDALSIEELGKPAIAIRGTSNTKLLYDLMQNQTEQKTLLLSLDIDNAGDNATKKILEDMQTLKNITCYDIRPLFAGYTRQEKNGKNYSIKDINEMLIYKKEQLTSLLQLSIDTLVNALQGIVTQEYINKQSATAYINEFLEGIKDSVNTPPIATGYFNLDEALNGGLREGLYTIGAISSLGKTTYILQMADQMAKQGQDVLIFSLEMSKTELIAKSISRNTKIYCDNNNIPNTPYAKSNIGITDGTKYVHYEEQEKHIIKQAVKMYAEYSNNVFIYTQNRKQYNRPLNVNDIINIVNNHIAIIGHNPVVIIDYLQLLAPPQERLTDKQAVDITTVELKELSNTYKIPVIVISSFNRENYNTKVNFASFKESGNIEYTANVVLGMQLKGVGTKEFDVDKEKQQNPRNIEIKILKNRNGKTGGILNYKYYPQFNYFSEV